MRGCVRLFAAVALAFFSAVAAGDEPPFISAGEFLSGEFDFRPVRAKCVVKDAFRDEINPDYAYLTLLWDNRIVYAAVPAKPLTDDDIAALIGASIVATGQPLPHLYDQREKLGRNLQILNPEAIQVTERATEDPFDVPDISSLYGLGPGDLVNIGRRRFRGRVLAVWDRTTVLLSGVGKFNMPETVTAKLVNTPAPAVGEEIETSGFPETDIYHYTLVRARWRGISAATNLPPASVNITAKGMTTDETGRTRYRYEMHGKVVSMRGRVHSVHDAGGRILLEDGGLIVPVDVSATEDATLNLSRGCVVEATGVCVMEIENWQMNSVFPQIKGFFLVVRTPDDIRIVARPPWWTAARLVSVIATLLAALVAILVWNIALRRVAARKGRELFQEQIERVEADLRTEERTRLAVELHDTLAQNLTGVSMEIEAGHVDIAARTLKSCRDELRNCLWDLRSQALEEKDMSAAVLRTLQPIVNTEQVKVRFNVPREKLSDNTAHALLRTIRELVVNALRHGNAQTVKVAGSIDGETILCSVTDDGCGFDPDESPGILQGHFGLQGVRERIAQLGGTFTIESAPGKGTKATIRI